MVLPAFKMIRVQLILLIQQIAHFFLLISEQMEAGLEMASYKLILEWTSLFLGKVEKEQLVNTVRLTEVTMEEGKNCFDEWKREIQH